MKFTKEQLNKAASAKSADELLMLAKENGIELTAEEAAGYYADCHKADELANEELEDVSGGCGEETPGPKFHAGDTVYLGNPLNTAKILELGGYDEVHGYYYNIYCLRKHTYEKGFEWEMRLC